MFHFFRKIYSSPKATLFYGVLSIIFIAGVFVRTYHFSDWLHFETDQVDDYFAVAPAVDSGIGKLPIVGPKAAGTDLRLGPVFYFFEFISATIFGNTPAGHAGATVFFAIISIPLFFLTSRLFFEKTISLFLTGIFSTSLFLTLYSRFSWNPNLLPFFTLLVMLSLVKAVSEKNVRKQTLWFASFASALAITMQLHISAFVTFPAFVGCFFLWRRPRITKRAWLIGTLLFLLVFTPTILYEIRSEGQTFRAFIKKTDAKSETTNKGRQEKIVQNIRYHAGEYLLILTGHDAINGGSRPNGTSLGLSCSSCAEEAPYRVIGYIFLFSSVVLLIRNISKETDKRKKDFLVLVLLWFLFSFIFFLTIMLSGKYLYPRFFLLVAPIPLFFFGFILRAIDPRKDIVRFYMTLLFAALIILVNTKGIFSTFEQNTLAASDKKIEVSTEDVFPDTGRITLEQQQRIVDFISEKALGSKKAVYLKSESEYEPSLWLLLNKNGIDFYGNVAGDSILYKEGLYVFVFRSASPFTKDMKSYQKRFSIDEEVSFGSLTLQILEPKPEFIGGIKQREPFTYQQKHSALDIPRFKDTAKP